MGDHADRPPLRARARVRRRFAAMVAPQHGDPPLVEAALVIAQEEYPGLRVPPYLARLHAYSSVVAQRVSHAEREWARSADEREVARRLGRLPDEERIRILNRYLFEELRFTGNREAYEDPRNSFLNEVLERRTGIPITLSLVYMEVARGAGLDLVGVGFPGHFLVRTRARRGAIRYLDPFNHGAELTRDELAARLAEMGQSPAETGAVMRPISNRAILRRLLLNLKVVYVQRNDWERARGAVERLLLLDPESADELRELGAVYGYLGLYDEGLRVLEAHRDRVEGDAARAAIDEAEIGLRYWLSRLN